MKRWAMCLTPRAAAAPSAVRPARLLPIRIAALIGGVGSLDLAEEAGQVAGEVVERAARRDDVDEAEQRGLQLAVLGGELHRLLVGELERVARRRRHRRRQPLADGEQLLLERALLDHAADDTLGAHEDRRGRRRAHRGRRRRGRAAARAAATSRSPHGALSDAERDDWAWASEAAARDVAEGRAEQAVVCCWTGTGASIAANKVRGIRAALCGDAATAAGARKWNDANVLALSLRTTSPALLEEILDAWFEAQPSAEDDDRANVEHLDEIESAASKRTTPPALPLGDAALPRAAGRRARAPRTASGRPA